MYAQNSWSRLVLVWTIIHTRCAKNIWCQLDMPWKQVRVNFDMEERRLHNSYQKVVICIVWCPMIDVGITCDSTDRSLRSLCSFRSSYLLLINKLFIFINVNYFFLYKLFNSVFFFLSYLFSKWRFRTLLWIPLAS